MVCKNCNTLLKVTDAYCNHCGAKVIRNRLTFKNLLEHFSAQFLNYDNKFLQTFIKLLTKPETVISSYIDGTRKKYVNVISYFAIALTITGLQYFILNKFYPEFIDISAITTKESKEFSNDFMRFIQDYQSIALMAFVPFYALMSKIVFFNIKRHNYTEHIVIFMYIVAQLTILGAFISLISAMLNIQMGYTSPLVIVLHFLYSTYCLKRLYSLSIKGIVLRTLFFLVVLLVFYAAFMLVFIFSMISIYGGIEGFIEAMKSASQ